MKDRQVYLGYIEASAGSVFDIVSAVRLKTLWNHKRITAQLPVSAARMRDFLELERPVFRLNVDVISRTPLKGNIGNCSGKSHR